MYVSQNNIYQLLRSTYVVHEELTIVRPVYVLLLAADHLILILIRAGFFELLERVHKSDLGRNIVHSTIVLDGTYHSSTK